MGTYSKFSGSLAYSKFFGSFIFQILRISDTIIFLTGIAKIFGTRKRKFGGGRSEEKKFFRWISGLKQVFLRILGSGFWGGEDLMDHIKHPKNLRKKKFFLGSPPPKNPNLRSEHFLRPKMNLIITKGL